MDNLKEEVAKIINSGHVQGYDISNDHVLKIIDLVRKHDREQALNELTEVSQKIGLYDVDSNDDNSPDD